MTPCKRSKAGQNICTPETRPSEVRSDALLAAASYFRELAVVMDFGAEHNGQRRFRVEASDNATRYRAWAEAITEAANTGEAN